MPLLEIATAQPNFQNHLGGLRAQGPIHPKLLSSAFTFGSDSRLTSTWKSLNIPGKRHSESGRPRFVIKAVATLELKRLALKENGHLCSQDAQDSTSSSLPASGAESPSEDSADVGEREKLRRMRISKANKGNTPWNKGRKHSPETLQRIRERTRLAMQNPKVKMKLVNLGHAQSEETRIKIGVGVRMGWQKRREKLMVQETCLFEWQNLIAEASRKGNIEEEELQWDSYDIQNKKLEEEWLESVEERKTVQKQKGSKRAPKSLEQRRKIAAAIAAKWADPSYREKVCSGLAKYHGVTVGTERKPRRNPTSSTDFARRSPPKRKTSDADQKPRRDPIERARLKRGNAPLFKDPLASSKLEMIKNIRAQRAAAETNRSEAIERARLLIAEAERAAQSLEVAAISSPIARASLVETRKLIAEAIQSIESIEPGLVSSNESSPSHSSSSYLELASFMEEEAVIIPQSQPADRKVNGSPVHATRENSNFKFAPFDLESKVEEIAPNGHHKSEKKPLPNGIKTAVQSVGEDLGSSRSATGTKKWVRGRLVEVAESS